MVIGVPYHTKSQ